MHNEAVIAQWQRFGRWMRRGYDTLLDEEALAGLRELDRKHSLIFLISHRSYLDEYLVRRGMLEGLGGPSVQSAFSYAANALRQEHPDRMPVEYDDATGPLILGVADGVHRSSAPPASTTTTTVARSGSRPAPASPSTTQQPTQQQHCIVTAGSLVRCPD